MSFKIGVLGAPGSGKTKFARALRRWDGWNDLDQPLIIDNYVPALARKTGLALGPWASYVENFMVAGERMKQEEAHSDGSTITVGTIVDTLMYCVMHGDVMLHRDDNDRRVAYMQAQNAMQAITMWYTETWAYNLAFFLAPSANENSIGWQTAYGRHMPDVLETYDVPGVVTIAGGDNDKRVKFATEVITLARTEEPGYKEAEQLSSAK